MLDKDNSDAITSEIIKIVPNALDTIIVYYAGHGIPFQKKLYLATKKTEYQKPPYTGAIESSGLIDLVIQESKQVKNIIFIIDCCFSAMTKEGVDSRSKNVFFITAAPSTQAAKDESPIDANYTAFTHELLVIFEQGIKNAGEILTLQDIFTNLEKQLKSENLPLPQIASHGLLNELGICKNQASQNISLTPELKDNGDVEKILETLLAEVRKLGERLDISPQIKPHDEFTQYTSATEVLIRQAISQFNRLPNHLDYPQSTLQTGSLASALGDFKSAENLLVEIYHRSQNTEHQALAAFNLFHLDLRQGAYDTALQWLKEAIRLHRAAYVLHNIERYPFHRLLGAGGMGCVFLCHDTLEEERASKEHFVAVKCLWKSQRGEPKKIFAEAMTMARVAGEYVPKPLDYGYADNIKRERAYFITEWIEDTVDGEAWLAKQGKMDFTTGVTVGIQVAQGLVKAHQHGILHLDLKPANLLLQANETGLTVKIIDFGLARIATSLRQQVAAHQRIRSTHSQLAQQIFGTFDYAPPEQRGDNEYRQVTEKSDVFAWGKTLYRLLSGERPQDNLRQKYLPDVRLHELLEDCVEANPAKRPKMTEVLARLKALLLTIAPHSAKSSQTQVEQVTQIETPRLIKTFKFEIVIVNAKGEITCRESKQALYEIEDLGNGVTLEMVSIPGGSFIMGSPKNERGRSSAEDPQHRVTIQPFWMSKYQVTQRQWQAVMGKNPSYFKGDNRPVENVSWHDVVAFCQRLSEKTGKTYRLPSEAEWEYACRAGTTTPFYFGETITTDLVNYLGDSYAVGPKGVSRGETTEVGIFLPNAFGLYDMHGNVWEWCADPWHDNYEGAPTDGHVWQEGGNDSLFALRGGSWDSNARRGAGS